MRTLTSLFLSLLLFTEGASASRPLGIKDAVALADTVADAIYAHFARTEQLAQDLQSGALTADDFARRLEQASTDFDEAALRHDPERIFRSGRASTRTEAYGVDTFALWGLGSVGGGLGASVFTYTHLNADAGDWAAKAVQLGTTLAAASVGISVTLLGMIGVSLCWERGERLMKRWTFGPDRSELLNAYDERLRQRGLRPPSRAALTSDVDQALIAKVANDVRPYVTSAPDLNVLDELLTDANSVRSRARLIFLVAKYRLFDKFPLVDLLTLSEYPVFVGRCNSLLAAS